MISSTNTILRKYGNIPMKLAGEVKVTVQYKEVSKLLILLIVDETGPSLLGRDWIHALQFPFLHNLVSNPGPSSNIDSVKDSPISEAEIESVLGEFPDLFRNGLGTFKDLEVSIDIDESVQPRFFKPRPVPFSLKAKIDTELDNLIRDNIIQPVKYSRWAAPVVPVVKPNGNIRICGDYKLTCNKAIKMDTYPLPKVQELFAKLAGGKLFAKLDISQAYHQLCIDENSKKYTTINTHRGLFMYNRLCFGISSAPALFQRQMEIILKDLDQVLDFSDDIFISGKNKSDFLSNLRKVLGILQKNGLRLNKDKCIWCMTEITYLGFRINSKGIFPTDEKVKAIRDAPPPTDILQLQAFLGLLNFYRSFLPNASTVLEPLNRLLRKDKP